MLLVEDDPAVRDATRMLLKVEGYRVTAVASLAEAIKASAESRIDLLVTDYHLSNEETGTQVIAALREIADVAFESRAHDRRHILRGAQPSHRRPRQNCQSTRQC